MAGVCETAGFASGGPAPANAWHLFGRLAFAGSAGFQPARVGATIMIYTHVLNRGSRGVQSPLDFL